MRNKIGIGILMFFWATLSFSGFSQTPEEINEEVISLDSMGALKEISNDSLLKIAPIDTSCIAEKTFNDNFAQAYTDDEFDYKNGGGKSPLQKFREWINNILRHLLGYNKLKDFNHWSTIFLRILYAIIFLASTYIIVRLIMNHKGRWFFNKKNENVAVNLENVEEHIHEADFESMIRETEQAGNTRQSIRLYYLWLLKTLTDKELIDWHPEKTNSDYVRELKDETQKANFRYLSYLYNHIWYGEFSINDEEYRNARQAFLNQLNPTTK